MKTLKTSIENFTADAMSKNELVYILGGGGENPIDMLVPPDAYKNGDNSGTSEN